MFTPEILYDCKPKRNTPDGHIRYVLKPISSGTNPLFVIGLNPSHADEYGLDDTVKNVEQFAEKKGHSHFVMFNLCPLRTPDPNVLVKLLKDENHDLLNNNRCKIECELNLFEDTPTIFACWGKALEDKKFEVRKYLIESLENLLTIEKLKNAHWFRIKSTSDVPYPMHPSRRNLKYFKEDFELKEWKRDEIESYLNDCKKPFSKKGIR